MREADETDQAHYRSHLLTDTRERFAAESGQVTAKAKMLAASIRLLDSVTALQQADEMEGSREPTAEEGKR